MKSLLIIVILLHFFCDCSMNIHVCWNFNYFQYNLIFHLYCYDDVCIRCDYCFSNESRCIYCITAWGECKELFMLKYIFDVNLCKSRRLWVCKCDCMSHLVCGCSTGTAKLPKLTSLCLLQHRRAADIKTITEPGERKEIILIRESDVDIPYMDVECPVGDLCVGVEWMPQGI